MSWSGERVDYWENRLEQLQIEVSAVDRWIESGGDYSSLPADVRSVLSFGTIKIEDKIIRLKEHIEFLKEKIDRKEE